MSMKLQLYTDGTLKGEMTLPNYEFGRERFKDFEKYVDYRRTRMWDYQSILKADCYRQLNRARYWEIFLIAESKLNSDIELYAQRAGGVELPR